MTGSVWEDMEDTDIMGNIKDMEDTECLEDMEDIEFSEDKKEAILIIL